MQQHRIFLYRTVCCILVCAFLSMDAASAFSAIHRIAPTMDGGGVLNRRYVQPAISLLHAVEVPVDLFCLHYWKNNLYVETWTSKVLHKIDASTGRVMMTYGRQGRGPGEFMQPTSVTIDSNGIAVLDRMNATVSEFSHQGTLLNSYKIPETGTIERGTKLQGTQYLLRTLNFEADSETEETFKVVDVKTGSSKVIKSKRREPTKAQGLSKILETSGPIFHSNAERVFRVATSNSLFTAFDMQGHPLYEKHTIDRADGPEIVKKSVGGTQYVINTGRLINASAWADTQYLYILSNAAAPDIPESRPGSNAIGVIDVYRAATGDYVFSFKIPEYKPQDTKSGAPSSFVIADGKLYTINGVYVCTYSLTLPKAP